MSWLDDAETMMEMEAAKGREVEAAAEWKPDAGETLIGTVLKIGAVITKFGLALKVWVRDQEGDVYQVFGSASMFKEEFLAEAPAVDMGIAIRYDGKGEGQYAKALWYISTEPHDKEAATEEILAIIASAEEIARSKAAAKQEREPAPPFNGSGDDDDDMTAPF